MEFQPRSGGTRRGPGFAAPRLVTCCLIPWPRLARPRLLTFCRSVAFRYLLNALRPGFLLHCQNYRGGSLRLVHEEKFIAVEQQPAERRQPVSADKVGEVREFGRRKRALPCESDGTLHLL